MEAPRWLLAPLRPPALPEGASPEPSEVPPEIWGHGGPGTLPPHGESTPGPGPPCPHGPHPACTLKPGPPAALPPHRPPWRPREFLPCPLQPPWFPVWKWGLDPAFANNIRREKSPFKLPVCCEQPPGPSPPTPRPGSQALLTSSGVSSPRQALPHTGCRESPPGASVSSVEPGTPA